MTMPMGSALPDWLTPVAWTYIALSLLSAAVVATDIFLLRRRHDGVSTELVWITSALYLGPFAIPAYTSRGRAQATRAVGEPSGVDHAAAAVLPGGSASAVAHLIAVPLVLAVGWTIAGLAMWPMILVIAVLATAILAVYERAASRGQRSTRGLSFRRAVVVAVITVAAFDVGMVGWMLLLHVNDLMPPANESTFWFLMQLGVIVGLVTGYPAVRWLLRQSATLSPA